MAHKKAGGSTSLGRDSQPQYLGVKLNDGQFAKTGAIIIRQRGTKYLPGKNVLRASDDTLHALHSGTVHFTEKKRTRFDGTRIWKTVVNVLPKKTLAD